MKKRVNINELICLASFTYINAMFFNIEDLSCKYKLNINIPTLICLIFCFIMHNPILT